MFSSKRPATDPTPTIEPRLPRRRVRRADAHWVAPSTFASRQADADHANTTRSQPRLVSIGRSEFRQRTRDGDVEILDVELFIDLDHPANGYVRFAGSASLHALQDDKRTEQVTRPAATTRTPGSGDPQRSTYDRAVHTRQAEVDDEAGGGDDGEPGAARGARPARRPPHRGRADDAADAGRRSPSSRARPPSKMRTGLETEVKPRRSAAGAEGLESADRVRALLRLMRDVKLVSAADSAGLR